MLSLQVFVSGDEGIYFSFEFKLLVFQFLQFGHEG